MAFGREIFASFAHVRGPSVVSLGITLNSLFLTLVPFYNSAIAYLNSTRTALRATSSRHNAGLSQVKHAGLWAGDIACMNFEQLRPLVARTRNGPAP